METQIQIQTCKKILKDELGFDEDDAEKVLLEAMQKFKELDQSLSYPEFFDKFLDKFEIETEKSKLLKAVISAYDPTLSLEDYLRKVFYFGLVARANFDLPDEMIQKNEELNPDLSDSEWDEEFFVRSFKDQKLDFRISFLRNFLHYWAMFHQIEEKQN